MGGEGYAILFSIFSGILMVPFFVFVIFGLEILSTAFFVYPSYRYVHKAFAVPSDHSGEAPSNTKAYIIVIFISLLLLGLLIFLPFAVLKAFQTVNVIFVLFWCAYWILFISFIKKSAASALRMLKFISYAADIISLAIWFASISISNFLEDTLKLNLERSLVLPGAIIAFAFIVGPLIYKRSLIKKIQSEVQAKDDAVISSDATQQ